MAKKKAQQVPVGTFSSIFSDVPEPRLERTKAHSLESILFLSLCAVVCGADTFVAIEKFGEAKEEWLTELMPFPNGIPSHDTIGRVFALVDTDALSEAFARWTQVAASNIAGVVAIDGKTLRRSFKDGSKKAFVHVVSAWSAEAGIVLGQVKTEDKSNEITAIPRLLDMLNVAGCLVTIDAMGCQRAVATKIVEKGGDYLLAVKDNQPGLESELALAFESVMGDSALLNEAEIAETRERGHGREKRRRCVTVDISGALECGTKWEGLRTAVFVERSRTVGSKTTIETQFYISSRAGLSPQDGLRPARTHWEIENKLYWVLDVSFREDDSRVRVGNAAANFAVVRHLAVNLLRDASSVKAGIQTKRLRAGWDHEFLSKVLLGRG